MTTFKQRLDELVKLRDEGGQIKYIGHDAITLASELHAEVERLEKALHAETANRKELARRNAFFRQRDDLPVDRIPAHDYLVKMIESSKRIEFDVAEAKNHAEIHYSNNAWVIHTLRNIHNLVKSTYEQSRGDL